MNSFFRNAFLFVLVLGLILSVGCASGTYGTGIDAELITAQAGGHVGAGLQHTSGGGEAKAIIYCVIGILFVVAVVIDVLALPGTAHDPFPCCRGLISICH